MVDQMSVEFDRRKVEPVRAGESQPFAGTRRGKECESEQRGIGDDQSTKRCPETVCQMPSFTASLKATQTTIRIEP